MKTTVYRVYKLRDPVFADRYWNGVTLVKERIKWPKRHRANPRFGLDRRELAAIKFDGTGRQWSDRHAALAAYREYQITAAMVLHYKLATNKTWDALPLQLDLVTVEVTKVHVKEEALTSWPYATIHAGHRTSKATAPRLDFIDKIIQESKAPLTAYVVALPGTTNKGVPEIYRNRFAQVGVDPVLVKFPYVALASQTDLTALRLLFDRMEAWEFETGRKVI